MPSQRFSLRVCSSKASPSKSVTIAAVIAAIFLASTQDLAVAQVAKRMLLRPVKGRDHHKLPWDGRPVLGEIRIVAFHFAPRGWADCDGQLLPIEGNQMLYGLLGTMYGGDGRTTFGLPDLRGRTPVHVGQRPGTAKITPGQKFGGEQALKKTYLERGQERASSPPSLGLRYVINTDGQHPHLVRPGDTDAFPAEIRMFAGTTAPSGWTDCDGQELYISKHIELFAELGFVYGGDRKAKFRVPDLRGRLSVHEGDDGFELTRGEVRGGKRAVADDGEQSLATRACLGIRHMIALQGPKSRSARFIPVPLMGEIRIVPGNAIPRGWAACNGQTRISAHNESLFSLLGIAYVGEQDNAATNPEESFSLPDLRGRTPVCVGEGHNLDDVRQGQESKRGLGISAEDAKRTVNTLPCIGVRYIISLWSNYPSRN